MNKEIIDIDAGNILNNDEVEVEAQQSKSAYQAIRSAISYVYKLACVPMPENMRLHLKKSVNGKIVSGGNNFVFIQCLCCVLGFGRRV